jgi:hypothetical protein
MTADELHRTLGAAVTRFDRMAEQRAARSRRGYHNRYALGQYLLRVDEIAADVRAGSSPRAAILAGFSGRLADACLKAIGEPKASDAEARGDIRGYMPASER